MRLCNISENSFHSQQRVPMVVSTEQLDRTECRPSTGAQGSSGLFQDKFNKCEEKDDKNQD